MKLSTDETEYRSKALTSHKKNRNHGLCSDFKPTYNTDKSEKTSKKLAEKCYSNYMSNGTQFSNNSSYPISDITLTQVNINSAKDKLPNFNDVSNVERNSCSTAVNSSRHKYAFEARCLKGKSKPNFE